MVHPIRCRISALAFVETNERNRRRKHQRFQVQHLSPFLSQAVVVSMYPSQVEILNGAINT